MSRVAPATDSAVTKQVMQLYTEDIRDLALRNQTLRMRVQPRSNVAMAQYSSMCGYVVDIASRVAHRPLDVGRCADFATTRPAEQRSAPVQDGQISAIQGGQISASAPANTSGLEPPPLSLAPMPQGGGEMLPAPAPSPDNGAVTTAAQSDDRANRQRNFELVANYIFYDSISFGLLNSILVTPSEFLAFVLVCASGILGALLRVILRSDNTGANPAWRDLIILPLLGLISALIIYVLFRAGFIAITDQRNNTGSTSLSPPSWRSSPWAPGSSRSGPSCTSVRRRAASSASGKKARSPVGPCIFAPSSTARA